MGVKGFWNYFYAFSNLHELLLEHVRGVGSTLLVDGSSFMFYLMNLVSREDGELIDRRYGGSYEEFRRIIRREFNYLLDLGFKVVVFFDGRSSKFKEEIQRNREAQGSSNWEHFYDVVQYQYTVIDQDALPLPTLTRTFFELVLRQDFAETIQLIHCQGEADVDLGIQCAERCQQGASYIYSQDSDFAVMRDCALVKFGVFAATEAGGRDQGFHVPVLRRRSVSAALGLTERQLVEFCILLGCDFTASHELHNSFADYRSNVYAPPHLRGVPPFVLEEGTFGARAFTRLLSLVRAQGTAFSLCAVDSNTELQLAIRYSRAFFDLDTAAMAELTTQLVSANAVRADLEELGLLSSGDAESDTVHSELLEDSDDSDDEVEDYTIRVPAELETAFLAWVRANPPQHFAQCATKVLQYCGGLHDGTFPLPAGLTPESLPLQLDHLTALAEMMRTMQAPGRVIDEHPHSPMASWETVTAGKVYQDLLYRALREHFALAQFGPLEQLYDGRTFYHALDLLRNSEAVESIEETEAAELRQAMLRDAMGSDEVGQQSEEVQGLNEQEVTEVDDFAAVLPVCVEPKRSEILDAIWSSRVVVVNGKTGCGKSTRLPLMIHEEARRRGEECCILVSEPHRLAAQGLYGRVNGSLPTLVSLKLGREGSRGPADAPITYATAGYIFHRYVSKLGDLTRYTHVIIDEVHERSVENDLVFLIVKHLLRTDPQVRVVLMSATPHTEVFHQYYADFGPLATVTVPTHNHELTRYYIEDLRESDTGAAFQAIFTRDFELSRQEVIRRCDAMLEDHENIANSFTVKQIDVALGIVSTCRVGTAVLIFVTGMAEINLFEMKLRRQRNVQFVAIHSDLAAGHERSVLTSLAPDRVRVIVATNAAESSITLPDVDVVICLGTFNQEQYDSTQFARTVLKNSWISKPSAEQRAGRTARVRPGTAYHLYTRALHDQVFRARNPPAIVCKPLHDVLVRVLGNLQGFYGFPTVSDLLLNLIEPPAIGHIQTSLDYLFGAGMIDSSSIETCALTAMGRFASRLPMSTHLSRMVSMGISLGVGAFAVILSVILGRQISRPFRSRHLAYTNADDYNDRMREVFLETVRTDYGTYSEPIMLVRLFCNWAGAGYRGRNAMKVFLDPKKITMLEKEAKIAQNRVNDVLEELNSELIDFDAALVSRNVNGDVITLLQYLLVWSSGGNVLKYVPPEPAERPSMAEQERVLICHNRVTQAKVNELFPPASTPGLITPLQRGFLRLSGTRKLPTAANPQAGRVTEQNLVGLIGGLLTVNGRLQAVWAWSSTAEGRMFVVGTQDQRNLSDLQRILEKGMQAEPTTPQNQFFTIRSVAGRPCYFRTVRDGDFRDHAMDRKLHLLFRSSYEVFFSCVEETASILVKSCNASFGESVLDCFQRHLGHAVRVTQFYDAPLANFQQVSFNRAPVRAGAPASVVDIPLGMRLLNAYCRKRNHQKLNISTFDAVPNREPHSWYSISTSKVLEVRGRYAQWNLLNRGAGGAVAVEVATAPPILRDEEFTRAGIDSYSYLHHTVPQLRNAQHVVYAVANTVVISQRGDRQSVLCDQVTILPHPEQWLTCAMSCVDVGWEAYAQPNGAHQTASIVSLCGIIRARLLELAKTDVVAYDDALVHKVFALHRSTRGL